MSNPRDYPFADLTDADIGRLVARSHLLRSQAALAAFRAAWRRLRWFLAPAGRPWRAVFRPAPRFTPDPPRAHC